MRTSAAAPGHGQISSEGSNLIHGTVRQIRIWHYPETTRPPIVVDTRHQANLFGVRFLPCTNNLQLVSGAMDYTVQVLALCLTPTAKPEAERMTPAP